jgi:hypothetical protein
VCVVHGKAALTQAIVSVRQSGTNKHFCGLVFTALRLLPPTKSVTQAKRQHVLFGRCLLADITFQALYIHCNRTFYLRHKVSASCAPFFAILSPNWPL